MMKMKVYIHSPQLLQEVLVILCQRVKDCIYDYNKDYIYGILK